MKKPKHKKLIGKYCIGFLMIWLFWTIFCLILNHAHGSTDYDIFIQLVPDVPQFRFEQPTLREEYQWRADACCWTV